MASAAALLIVTAVLVAACGSSGPSPAPTVRGTASPSLPATSLPPTLPPLPTLTPDAVATPSSAPWPEGWQDSFCALFAESVVMQELAVDIGRALDEDAREDAAGLTAELATTAASVREQLAALPEWEAAAPYERQMVGLLDLADEMAARYARHFETDRQGPLNAARAAGGEMGAVVERVLDRLTNLQLAGLACPGVQFSLEAPPEP